MSPIFISQSTDFHFPKYRFSFRFVSFRFASTVSQIVARAFRSVVPCRVNRATMPMPSAKASKPNNSTKNKVVEKLQRVEGTVNPTSSEHQTPPVQSGFSCTLHVQGSTNAATTTKTSRRKADTIIGYVHHLSPSKRNKRNTMYYSTIRLQTSASVIEEGLVYSKSKRPLLADSD